MTDLTLEEIYPLRDWILRRLPIVRGGMMEREVNTLCEMAMRSLSWREDMENCPKDRLILVAGRHEMDDSVYVGVGRWDAGYEGDSQTPPSAPSWACAVSCDWIDPTHWREFPPPPTATSPGKEELPTLQEMIDSHPAPAITEGEEPTECIHGVAIDGQCDCCEAKGIVMALGRRIAMEPYENSAISVYELRQILKQGILYMEPVASDTLERVANAIHRAYHDEECLVMGTGFVDRGREPWARMAAKAVIAIATLPEPIAVIDNYRPTARSTQP
jgi:hypothetical protein